MCFVQEDLPLPHPLGWRMGLTGADVWCFLAAGQCNECPLEAFWEMANLRSPETTLRVSLGNLST